MVEQIDAYIEHLHTLRNRFLQHQKLANRISLLLRQDSALTDIPPETNTGLLFLLRDDLNIQAVTPRSLGDQVPWNLVANFNRHYLRTTLRERGCPAVYVDYLYGHWAHGEEPFQPHSMVSPLEMAQVLVPHLDAINTNLGWRVVEGLIGG